MAKKQPATVERPARKKPDFSGVPGEIVNASNLPLEWGTRIKRSPYDPLLRQLQAAPPGSALKFGAVKAWGTVSLRARKLGIKIEQAIDGDVLYVRISQAPPDPNAERDRRHEAVRKALSKAPGNPIQIAALARQQSNIDLSGPQAEVILMQLSRAGEAELKDGRWYPVRAA